MMPSVAAARSARGTLLETPSAVVRLARRLRALGFVLEAALAVVMAGSIAAIGSVHPWARLPLWGASAVVALLLAARVLLVRALRRQAGAQPLTITAGPRAAPWTFDPAASAVPRPPLLLPAVAFSAWVGLQLLPWPASWSLRTSSPALTLRGLAFVGSLLALHLGAAAVFADRAARVRFRRFVAALGLALALVALVQIAAGATRIYGFFQPWDGLSFFGPLVNRNHFAGYMLMVAPVCLDLLSRAWRHFTELAGPRPGWRRVLVRLGTPQGTALIYTLVPAVATVGALMATTSRGAITAFFVALLLAGIGLRRRGDVPSWALGLLVLGMALSWYGLERLELRFGRSVQDAPGRTAAWDDALSRMDGRWVAGWGFNTFAHAISRVAPWTLPEGATPWPAWLQEAAARGERPGYRAVEDLPKLAWYPEAHNDYVQLLVETGVPGLLIALWAGFAALRAARRDPWLVAALAGVLMHAFVEFDFQVPALVVLFAALAALRS